jgi:glycosyltransferase involved in cell wall biosynthesis
LDERVGIGQVISRIPREITKEIIVVDSSIDGTGEVARSHGALVIREDRQGYGRALQTGIGNATGEIMVYIDADMTYDPREIPKLVFPILRDEFDVMLVNRLQGKMDLQAMKPANRIGNTILSFVFSLVSQRRVSDSQCARALCSDHGGTV